MKKFKIILAALLCVIVVLPFIACGSAEDENTGGDNPANPDSGEENGAPVEQTDPNAPDLPKIDMGGKTFTFLTYKDWGGESVDQDIYSEAATGEPINDAAYKRRVKLEQEFNINIRTTMVENHTAATDAVRTAVMANDTSYDIAVTAASSFASLLTGGSYLTDFKQLAFIDVEKPYWNKSFYDAWSILGTNYALDGDISKRKLQCVWIMCFNKGMIRDYNLDTPYELVKNGTWTYDKMHEMARAAARDVDGDGVMSLEGDDIWGINYTGDTIMGIINTSGVKIAEFDSDGIPVLTVGTEVNLVKLARIYDQMRDHEYSIDTLFKAGGGVTGIGDVDIFAENRALFLACAGHNVQGSSEEDANNTQGLRDIDVDFGIIPYPKWSVSDEYVSYTAGNYHNVMAIPKTNEDLDNTSILLEAMAYEGSRELVPAFYENLLKTKTARDNESEDMIEFIFGNLNYDTGYLFDFGGIGGVFGYELSTNLRANVVSVIERNSGVWGRAIDSLVDEVAKHE
ncbi:MAG: hypothetical protein FWH10_03610 [Oscillospiraceae bacterium]|nr:hypothetical protein [Oscillospiraceae bacterium]